MLLSVVLVSIVGLIPGQSTAALGAEVLALGLGFGSSSSGSRGEAFLVGPTRALG